MKKELLRDVKFWKDDGAFKLRVCGVVKVGDKILISRANEADFWGFPGGHVTLGETTDEAVTREVFEETKIEVEIVKLLGEVQLFFDRGDGKPLHEIGYYYLMKPKHEIETKDFNNEEIDHGELKKHYNQWRTLDQLKKLDVRPVEILNCVEKGLERQHIVRDLFSK